MFRLDFCEQKTTQICNSLAFLGALRLLMYFSHAYIDFLSLETLQITLTDRIILRLRSSSGPQCVKLSCFWQGQEYNISLCFDLVLLPNL
jgi:hypothetical protein